MAPYDPATADFNSASVPLAALQASLFRLMTLYSVMPCHSKARTIVRMLSALIYHPDLNSGPPLQAVYLQMLDTWTQLAQSSNTVRCVEDGHSLSLH